MKMVKSLLLGTAAGIMAVAGAQAADLPVKAKPVEYVKVCSLYGAGFFYIPGTDTCLKVGGMVRFDMGFNAGGSHGQYWAGAQAHYNNGTNDFQTRTRVQVSFDARTQTEYGTLRSFIRLGHQYTSTDGSNLNPGVYFDRGFIQLGGFTFGKTQSFFDAYSGGFNSFTTLVGASDTGNGLNTGAYTAQFGNGFSGTIGFEDGSARKAGNWLVDDAFNPGVAIGLNRVAGQQMPNLIGNLRVDQAWGSAQLSGAIQQVRATYYGNNLEGNGSPDDEYGFAIQGAAQFKLPWAAGDTFTIQASYSEGATAYTFGNSNGQSNVGIYDGANVFPGLLVDGVYDNFTNIELTKAFGVNAGIEHYWTPMLRTSVFGAYLAVDVPDMACVTGSWAAVAGCNPDWTMWQIGTRTVWNPVRNLDVGLEVLYTKFESDMAGSVIAATPGGLKPTANYTVEDRDVVSALVRIQRNFWP